KALAWLQADLDVYRQTLKDGRAMDKFLASERVLQLPKEADLAGVRAPKEAAKLPEAERLAWQKLWTNVEALTKEARAAYIESLHQGAWTPKEAERVHEMTMTAGKTYVIDMNSAQFDTYLRLESSKGKVLAENDDIDPPNNLNSRIVFTPAEDGTYRI